MESETSESELLESSPFMYDLCCFKGFFLLYIFGCAEIPSEREDTASEDELLLDELYAADDELESSGPPRVWDLREL